MDDFLAALKSRVNSPFLGSFSFALIALNWKAFFFVAVQDGDVLGRIAYFEMHTSHWSLLLWPFVVATLFGLLYPWMGFFLIWATSKPVELRQIRHAQSERRILIKKKQIEDATAGLFAGAERELIDRAKRDQELDQISNNELKTKLKSEIDQLRQQRNTLAHSSPGGFERHQELMATADTYRQRANDSPNHEDIVRFLERARELEDDAYKLISGSARKEI